MDSSPVENLLKYELLRQPQLFAYRYADAADQHLRKTLFRSLAGNREDYLRFFFPSGPPADRSQTWSLRVAQGAVDGAEYTTAAKGTACGHIFKSGESTYHCKTCATDDTCVLCARCFEASDHEGHTIFISVSPGNAGCCDCGDPEAWKRELRCSIHTSDDYLMSSKQAKQEKDKSPVEPAGSHLPADLLASVRTTMSCVIDYLCDVLSCSPEQLRLAKTETTIRADEKHSRLSTRYGDEPQEENPEFVLVLWNDEKHTIDDVQNQVARACQTRKSFGREKAVEVNEIGRSCVHYSTDVPKLVEMAEIIEQLKVTVTIRSARDTFREHMCATIIDWISDVAGCAVASDPYLLRQVVCEELLKPWRAGSPASNKDIGLAGLDDHEMEDNQITKRRYRQMINPNLLNVFRVLGEPEAGENDMNDSDNDHDEDEDNDEDEYIEDLEDFNDHDMDMDMEVDAMRVHTSNDMDIDFMEDYEDLTEAREATIAGYPPPPPPPPATTNSRQSRIILTPTESEDGQDHGQSETHSLYKLVPRTPQARSNSARRLRPSKHWLEKPDGFRRSRSNDTDAANWQQGRLAFLILYDLRLWKTLRTSLRHLYITTVVTLPRFKRVLGLQFATLYTALAQLYLIADREPDHSIINLSVQILTTPTIAQEVVERGNFLTNLMAILFTFLTTRQVGYPDDIDLRATLAFDAGAVTNRRIFHFFHDLRWLLQTTCVQDRLRLEPRYLLQFLDLIKLLQGVCPNLRATGEHVEYEPDAWISASMIVKEINKLCKLVTISFEPQNDDPAALHRVIRTVTQVTMINAFGRERKRFMLAEVREKLMWHLVGPFARDGPAYNVPKFSVQAESISFHHPLHYLLSWLLESAKTMKREEMRTLLHFSSADLKDPWSRSHTPPATNTLAPEELLCAVFEHPLRVCVWLAQMKAGMWVRNGVTLRHQAHSYRSVANRDVGYQRDILILQAGFVLSGADHEIPGERLLAQMIDRFEMSEWIKGDYAVVSGFEETQQLDVIEDFFHLLVIILSERNNLVVAPNSGEQHDRMLRHDIAHALCFKPLSFSDLAGRVTEKVGESDDFNRVLESMTTFRAPEGLTDSGTFELKPEFIELIDPFYAHYSRNHREEAEGILKKHLSQKRGCRPDEIVYEPQLQSIGPGLFQDLAAFTTTPLFLQVLQAALNYALGVKTIAPRIAITRAETFLHMVLHLIMLAAAEEGLNPRLKGQFSARAMIGEKDSPSLDSILISLTKMHEYGACHPTLKHLVRELHFRQPDMISSVSRPLSELFDRAETDSPASVSLEDKERKKQEALARQARIMAQMKQQQNTFLQNQGLSAFGEEFDESDDMSVTEESADSIQHRKIWNFPSGTCILCQEETDDQHLFGTFAYLCESNILRPTPMEDADYVSEVFDMPRDLDRTAEHSRPFGVAGKNRHSVQKVLSNGQVVNVERHGLSKGFPTKLRGVEGPLSTSCGHIMHFKCFELYLAATDRRHAQQIARDHPENIKRKEFVCPLCKALGNTFLPIVWKAKGCASEHELHAAKTLSDWLADLHRQESTYLVDNNSPIFPRRPDQAQLTLVERSSQYVAGMFIPSLSATLKALTIESSPSAQSQSGMPLRRGYSLSTLFRSGSASESAATAEGNAISPTISEQPQRMTDLVKAYLRIDESIATNELGAVGEGGKNPVVALSRALGLSISAYEIGHRGVNSDASTTSFVSEVSEQSLAHFRILCETIESHMAVSVLRHGAAVSTITRELAGRRDTMSRQLFGTDDDVGGLQNEEPAQCLFQDDIFLFLSDWLSFTGPDVADAINILQLCYWAEIVKVVFLWQLRGMSSHPTTTSSPSNAFRHAVTAMLAPGSTDASMDLEIALLQKAVGKYALTFLRKSILLMHVRYGLALDCPHGVDSDSPELDRLTALLHIPTIEDLCAMFLGQDAVGTTLRHMCSHWTQTADRTRQGGAMMVLAHPAMLELVGLPRNYDTLTEEAIRRRCPTTGKEVTDPAVCLFCGAIFCSQALCCLRDRFGGCYHHMGQCGGNVGMFIIIRKCMVLFLHRTKGSYAHAPYLDKHGEPDPTLRRHHQLFLNQRRYDKLLRDVWLQHSIPTVISRRLEGDVNPGGWETL